MKKDEPDPLELKFGFPLNDLNTNFQNTLISNGSAPTSTASTAIPCVEHSSAVNVARRIGEGRQTNGHGDIEDGFAAVHENNVNVDAVDDFDDCELQKSGSPCTSGGLHMAHKSEFQEFARNMRTRCYSQTHSDSGWCLLT